MSSLTTLVHQARHGHAEAIATLLNRHLTPHGITSRVILREGCLKILLESAQPLTRQPSLLTFIYRGLHQLKPVSVHQVRIYARVAGHTAPLWVDTFRLHPKSVQSAGQADARHPRKQVRALSWFETKSPPLVLAWLLLFYPVGLYSLWKHLPWSRLAKSTISSVTLILVIGYWLWRVPLSVVPKALPFSTLFVSAPNSVPMAVYTQNLRSVDPQNELISKVSMGSRVGEVDIYVTPTWEAQPYAARQKTATMLWTLWANLYSPKAPETAYIRIINRNGENIGGSLWTGSLVKVLPD